VNFRLCLYNLQCRSIIS